MTWRELWQWVRADRTRTWRLALLAVCLAFAVGCVIAAVVTA